MAGKLLAALLLIAFAAVPALGQATAVDPSAYTPSARIIGLGRAFTAMQDDAASIYMNPAGIAKSKDWKLTSMSGQFVEDFDYISLTGIYPTNFGVIGLGYDIYNIGGAPATTLDATSDPSDPIYMIDPTQPPINNFNSVLFLTYATEAGRFLKYEPLQTHIDKLSLGASLRMYSAGLSGDDIREGSASGMEMDFGAIYQAAPWLALGGSLQNALPADMGGKLTYAGGHTETYPALLKLGAAVNILGETDALREMGQHRLTGIFDLNYSPTLKNWPMTYNMGFEYKPIDMIALRVGLDQTAMGNGSGGFETPADLCFGVGLNYTGFRFDYAYHGFSAMPGVDNHSFSFSYAPPVKKVVEEVKKMLTILAPEDKTMTFAGQVDVKLNVADTRKVQYLDISGQGVPIPLDGDVSATVPLEIGKNKITVNALDRLRLELDTENIRLLRLVTFPDVPEGHWAREQVALISMLKVVQGYPDGTFKPEGNITRAEMATLLMRTAGDRPPASRAVARFKDVRPAHWASTFVNRAAADGIVQGYPDGTFKPNGNITRAEGLAMIARFAGITREAYRYQYFPDVRANHWAAELIAGASNAGILDFLRGKPFEPSKLLTRAEAVEMLCRTSFVKDLLSKDLLNWESY